MLEFRKAERRDLEAIVAMFADDELGQAREDASVPLNAKYVNAFKVIEVDPNQHLLVGERDSDLVAFLQISFIPHLSRLGSVRGQIESVRVASSLRGQGIGGCLVKEAISICQKHGCSLVQLTTDKARSKTEKFYEDLGFVTTHNGMKMKLED